MQALFWLSVLFFAYTLLIYPGVMALLGWLRPRRLRKANAEGRAFEPTVSLIVAACNEERHLGFTLDQLREADYLKDKIDAVVASDAGSTDRTHAIAAERKADGWRLVQPASGLVGKNVSLDEAVRQTKGEILVFADATARWQPDGIRELVANFADPRVGCVSARKAYWLEDGFGPDSYRKYWELEALVDQGSSVLGYIPNASGGFHALRRELYRPVPNHMIRDLIDPAQAAGAGKLAVLDPSVRYADAPWVGAEEVYRSRLRITRRVLFSTPYILRNLWRGRGALAVWQFASHKLCRWLLWLPALGMLLASAALAPFGGFYAAVFGLQALAYASVWPTLALSGRGVRVPLLTHGAFFALSLIAMAHGWWSWLRGERQATWRLKAAKA